ncbi:MAG TPA: TetR/AcrR family transcriptional regulator [Microthrixaceae bacterium]|nr:TetR/AcrR family transcriptional regulator [Microthrixaceae bacterium]
MSSFETPTQSSDQITEVDPRVQRSRTRLLDAAEELMVESGVRSVTVDAVAERSGVAKSTLYRHWPSIEGLLLDVLRAAIPAAATFDLDSTFEDCLRMQMESMAEALTRPRVARMLPELLALWHDFPEIERLVRCDRTENEELLGAILDLGVAEGRLPSGLAPSTVGTTLFGPMMMCAMFGDEDQIAIVGAYAMERFLASYPA